MKTVLFLLIALCCTACHGETLIVPSTTVTGVWSSVLESGVVYQFEASGTYFWDSSGLGNWADAEWFHSSNYPNNPNEYADSADPDYELFELCINDGSADWLGSIDGSAWLPHTFSATHVYRYRYTGTGGRVKFHIADTYPFLYYGSYEHCSDNIGSLRVEVTPVPEPSSLITLGTLLTPLLAFRRRRGVAPAACRHCPD